MFSFLHSNSIKKFTSAVIVAGGSGSRMGDKYPNKQFIELNEKCVLIRSIEAFDNAKTIDEIIVVVKDEYLEKATQLIHGYGFKKVKYITKGSHTRARSVQNGIALCAQKSKFVAIHDGARPLILTQDIEQICNQAYIHNYAAPCVKTKDTLKQIDDNGFILKTIDRETTYSVQTPQVFNLEKYKNACLTLLDKLDTFTDDCQIIESFGGKIKAVSGDYNNIKVTTESDIAICEKILEDRL